MTNLRRRSFVPKATPTARKVALPQARVRNNTIGGSVLGNLNRDFKLPKSITFVLDNSADAEAKKHLLFDSYGIVALAKGASNYDADKLSTKKLSKAIYNEIIKSHAIVFSGMRMEAKVSSGQFSNDITFIGSDLDGNVYPENVELNRAVNGDTYNPKIQNYEAEFTIDGLKAIEIPVDKGETVIVTMFVKGMTNVL